MGIFTAGAKVLSARDAARAEADARDQQQQREEEQRAQAAEERQVRMALLQAQLEQNHVVPNAQRDKITLPGASASQTMGSAPTDVRTPMRMPETPDLVHGRGNVAQPTSDIRTTLPGAERRTVQGTPSQDIVDPERYQELGQSGYSLDKNPGPSIVEQRKKAEQQTKFNQRVAALKAKHPDRYGKMGDQELIGIVSDDDAYREALKDIKPPAPGRIVTNAKGEIMQQDPDTREWKPTGMKAPPKGTAGGEGTIAVKREERLALQGEIEIKQRQLEQLDKAITAAGDPKFTPGDATAKAAAQAAYDRKVAQKDKLSQEIDGLVGRMDGQDKTQPTPEWMKGIKLGPNGVPEGIDLSLADGATQADKDQAANAIAMVDDKTVTMFKLVNSRYLSPAAKAVAWKTRINAGGTGAAAPPSAR